MARAGITVGRSRDGEAMDLIGGALNFGRQTAAYSIATRRVAEAERGGSLRPVVEDGIVRALVIGDVHADDRTPRMRKDNYLRSTAQELMSAFQVARERRVHAVYLLGDLFNRMDPQGICRNLMITILQVDENGEPWPFDVYAAIGNHDIRSSYAHLPNSALGTLMQAGAVKIVDQEPELGVAFAHWTNGVESDLASGLLAHKLKTRAVVWIAHANITLGPFPASYVLLRDLCLNDQARLVLAGHIHDRMEGVRERDGLKFVNPGSLCRISPTKDIPQVAYIEYALDGSRVDYELLGLPGAADGLDLFKMDEYIAYKQTREARKSYIRHLNSFHVRHISDPIERLRESAKAKNVPDAVLGLAVEFVQKQSSEIPETGDPIGELVDMDAPPASKARRGRR